MEYLLALIVLLGLFLLMSRPWRPKKEHRGGLGGNIFGSFDEIFNPGAKQASEIIEEQSRQIKPMPSPEDKPNP